jgi:adenylate cyclase
LPGDSRGPVAAGLSCGPDGEGQVRIKGSARAVLTIKGPQRGAERAEAEAPIALDPARVLVGDFAQGHRIAKTRHTAAGPAGLAWEIDVFRGANEGLVLAELEGAGYDLEFEKPAWPGPEVTSDPRYYNAQLSAGPYTQWSA